MTDITCDVIYNDFYGNSYKLYVSSLSMSIAVCEVGSLIVELPMNKYTNNFFARDGELSVSRLVNGIRYDFNKTWFIRKIKYSWDDNGYKIILTCEDNIGLLARRVVAYPSGNAYTNKYDTVDNIMKAIIRENFGDISFDPDRDQSDIYAVEVNTDLGPLAIKTDIAYKNVLSALKELYDYSASQGLTVIFDLKSITKYSYRFITTMYYLGLDRTLDTYNPIILSRSIGNVKNVEIEYDYSGEITYAYATGQGVGKGRKLQEYGDAARIGESKYNRIEVALQNITVAGKTQQQYDMLLANATKAVYQGRPVLHYTGVLIETNDTILGVHFNYGDALTAVEANMNMPVVINAITMDYDQANGVKTNISLRGDYVL